MRTISFIEWPAALTVNMYLSGLYFQSTFMFMSTEQFTHIAEALDKKKTPEVSINHTW